MRELFATIFVLTSLILSGQENEKIDRLVNTINIDQSLTLNEFDWVEVTGITSDGGGILKIWTNDNKICKIHEEIGLSYGRVSTTIYMNDETPIKIIETEENFQKTNHGFITSKLNEVFTVSIYVFDWEFDDSQIVTKGQRIMSEGSCSTFDYEPIIERAKKAMSK